MKNILYNEHLCIKRKLLLTKYRYRFIYLFLIIIIYA